MIERLKLLKDFEGKNNLSIVLNLYSDGSGTIEEFWDNEKLVEFKTVEELKTFLTTTKYEKDEAGLCLSPVKIVKQ